MKNLAGAGRLLRHSSRSLFDRRCSGPSYKSLRTYAQFMQDDCLHEKIMSKHNFFLRGYGVGSFGCSPKSQSNDLRTHHRNFASIASKPERNKSFASLNSDDISYFKKLPGEKGVVQDEEKLDDANTDWMRSTRARVSLCYNLEATKRCLAVVPQGGNTGLVGRSIPVYDEVIINIGSMNNILSFDKVSGRLVCGAGSILENLISFLDNEGYIMPLDLGAKRSCQIGELSQQMLMEVFLNGSEPIRVYRRRGKEKPAEGEDV